jgi:hypothetical protein
VIEEAFSQLARRRSEVRSCWSAFRAKADKCTLPGDCPPNERIETIGLTNVTSFTCWRRVEGLITDDFVFRRYFGEPEITLRAAGPTGSDMHIANIGRIRSDEPSPADFIKYLDAPPQCASVSDQISLVMIRSHFSSEQTQVWRMDAEYHPEDPFQQYARVVQDR